MTNTIHQPHDYFFKSALENLRVATDFLQQHLPKALQQQMDFSTLKLNQGSFIDPAFKNHEVDVLYQAHINHQTGFIYVLLEHQSTIDQLLPFRLVKYLIKIIEHHLKQKKTKVLPLVYPMVFYTGSNEYTGPKDIFALFGSQSELAKSIWLTPFHLIDAKQIPDDELKTHLWAGIMQFIFKQRALSNMMQAAEEFLKWLKQIELHGGFEYGVTMLNYIHEVDESIQCDQFIELAKQHLSSNLRKSAMTLKEQFMQQGFEQGSLNQSKIFVKNLLAENMALEKISQLTGLTIEEIRKLAVSYQTTE